MEENLLDYLPKTKSFDEPAPEEPKKVREVQCRNIEPIPDIQTISLFDWFEEHKSEFGNIVKSGKMSLTGVERREHLLVTIPDSRGGFASDGFPRRFPVLIHWVSKIRVLNLKPIEFEFFQNSLFRVLYDVNEAIKIRAYYTKTGLIVTFCYVTVSDRIVPYNKTKIRNNEKSVKVPLPDAVFIERAMFEKADTEMASVLYSKLSKEEKYKIKTFKDLIDWFTQRGKGVTDVNHLAQIDDVCIYVLNKIRV
jgi:hypothetical protein